MKKVRRQQVFETPSSAVHSLAISREGLEPCKLPMDGTYIVTDFGDYGDYDVGITAFDQETKLSYLATQCFYLNHGDENIEEYYIWQNICDAICKYSGASGVELLHKTEPELNHQELPEYGELKFCDPWDKDSIINFIFNRFVGVKMSHD